GRVQLAVWAPPPPRLAGVEQFDIGRAGGGDRDGLRDVFEEDAVARVQLDEVELLGGGSAHEPEEVVEHFGHEVPGGARVEAEAVDLEQAGATADGGLLLEQRHRVPLPGEEAGGREPRDAAADDDDALRFGRGAHARGIRPAAAAAARRTLTGVGTLSRAARMSRAGVARRRRASSAKSDCARHTALRLPGGSSGRAARETRRSESMSSRMRVLSSSLKVSTSTSGK